MSAQQFGYTKHGEAVTCYTLENRNGMQVSVLDRGAIIKNIFVPSPTGDLLDVVLGFDTMAGYEDCTGYVGALIGRHANRLGGAFLSIDGVRYPLTANEGAKQLHGGAIGFDQKLFCVCAAGENELLLTACSADGEEGYPGEVALTVRYSLSDDNALTLDYSAASTRDTVINLTNHSYFNLNGAESGSAMGHTLRVCADSFTPIDRDALPTGEIEPVCGTPFDFTAPKALGRDIAQDVTQLHRTGGYDHNFVLNKSAPHALELAAELQGDESGIRMTCTTSCPGLQLYTANFLASPPAGKNGAVIAPRQAICLETQYFPNSMNCPLFEAPILRVGSTYHETTIYKFGE